MRVIPWIGRSACCLLAGLSPAAWAMPGPDPVADAAPAAPAAAAPPPVTAAIGYKGDVVAVAAGRNRSQRGVRYMDIVDLVVAADLERVAGWRGMTAMVDVLNAKGGRANNIANTLQGVDNSEVSDNQTRLFQAWVQQSFAGDRLSLLVGRYDLNSEFYHNDAAAPLIAPAFGIGSELASTGPNGPSIFPQTALAVRLRATGPARVDGGRAYAQAAVVRAPRGIADDGPRTALLVAEAGWQGRTSVALGGWSYTRSQPRITPPGVTVTAGRAMSHGVYLLVEQDLAGRADAPGHWRAFGRMGLSDGRTTPFAGGWQLGVTGQGVVSGRPDSLVSLGASSGALSSHYRRGNPPQASPLARAESTIELTYSDRVTSFLQLQPDVQYVRRPGGVRDRPDALVVVLRAAIDWTLF